MNMNLLKVSWLLAFAAAVLPATKIVSSGHPLDPSWWLFALLASLWFILPTILPPYLVTLKIDPASRSVLIGFLVIESVISMAYYSFAIFVTGYDSPLIFFVFASFQWAALCMVLLICEFLGSRKLGGDQTP